MFIIKVENLSQVYSPGTPFEVVSLDNVSLEIAEGEFFALIGASGSGKTTLIQHFNGMLLPTAGKVRVCGIDLADKKRRRNLWRKVGLVFQQPGHQLFEATVFDDVAFGPRNLGLDRVAVGERVREALRLVGLDPGAVGGLSPLALSDGMRRRAAIAGVLAMRPQVLVLDEPTAGLDPRGREQLTAAFERLRSGRRVTVVLVSHSMEDVARLAGRVAVLHRGRLLMEGSPREVFSRAGELRAAGLEVPAPAALMHMLRSAGRKVRTDVLTNAEAEEEIARLLGRGDCSC